VVDEDARLVLLLLRRAVDTGRGQHGPALGERPAVNGPGVLVRVARERLDGVGQVRQQLRVLPPHHVRHDGREQPGLLQLRADRVRGLVRAGGIAAEVQDAGVRGARREHGARFDVAGGQPHAHRVHVAEEAQREALALHAVLRAHQRQPLAGRAAAPHRAAGPGGQRGQAVLRLDRQHQDVVRAEFHAPGPVDDRDPVDARPVRRGERQAPVAQHLEVRTARDEDDVRAGLRQPSADAPADRARSDDDVPHAGPLRLSAASSSRWGRARAP
jgi:hypothetical protein